MLLRAKLTKSISVTIYDYNYLQPISSTEYFLINVLFLCILQLTSSNLDSKLREDLERMKKIRAHRGLRHYWGLRVRGQHTKTTGRRGRTVGVSKKK